MLKRVHVENLRTGVFIHELCGSWMDHPFWRKSFLLEKEKDLRTIHACGISEVWIDTDKGRDVAAGEGKEAAEAAVDRKFQQVLATPAASRQQVSMADEIPAARQIVDKGKEAMRVMFHEARMGRALDTSQVMTLVEEISSSVGRCPSAIISLARLKKKDEYTYMHSIAVCALMVALARELGLDETQTREAGQAGLVHDMGKMAIPDEILNKPGKLTDNEFQLVKGHPERGHKLLLKGENISAAALDVCLHHHEKMDGSGYPHQLKDDDIGLFARMGAVCDVYDAITSNRPYKAGWDPAESLRKMALWSKGRFDERIFQAFVKCVGIYPVGSLVRLDSGHLGVVTEQSEAALLTPKVHVFFSTQSGAYIDPERVDLARPDCRNKIVAREDAEKWGIRNIERMWMPA